MEKGTKMKKTCSLFTGLLVGALVSSALVLLLTPWSGEELQQNIKDFANNFGRSSPGCRGKTSGTGTGTRPVTFRQIIVNYLVKNRHPSMAVFVM